MKYWLILWLLLVTLSSSSQTKKKRYLPIDSKNSSKFGRTSNVGFSKRIAIFPFSDAVNIQLVSFEDSSNGGQLDTTKIVYNEKMPRVRMAVCINPPKEIKTLNLIQIEN